MEIIITKQAMRKYIKENTIPVLVGFAIGLTFFLIMQVTENIIIKLALINAR